MIANIRIRDDLYGKLKESAKNNCRTITGELEMLLIKTYVSNSETSASSAETKEQLSRLESDEGEDLRFNKKFNEEAKSKWM